MSEYKDYNYSNDDAFLLDGYLLEPIVNSLDKNRNKTILDLGCGNGWMTNALLERGFNVYGIDPAETGIQIAKRRNPDRFFLQDLSTDDLPVALQGMPFDTIVSTEVIEHLYAPRDYLKFCRKILTKTGHGELILSTPYHGYLKNLALAVTGKLDGHFTVLQDGMHIKFWSRKTLTAILEEQGFRVTDFIGCGRMPYLWKSMIIKSRI